MLTLKLAEAPEYRYRVGIAEVSTMFEALQLMVLTGLDISYVKVSV